MNLIEVIKEMKRAKTFQGMINKTDMVSYQRSGSFQSVTIIYNINDNTKKKVEGYDAGNWQAIENFLRAKFTYSLNRKE